MFKQILVPLDGSRFGEFALPAALSIAERAAAGVRLVSAVTDLPPLPLGQRDDRTVRGWFDESRARASEYLENVVERVREAGSEVEVEAGVVVGPAVRTLAGEIRESSPDLVVMTTHGRGPLERAWVGSVTDGLLRRLSRPLLLVRPRKGEEADFADRPAFRRVLVPLDGSEGGEAALGPAHGIAGLYDGSVELLTILPPLFPVGSAYLPHLVEETRENEARRESFNAYLEEARRRPVLEGRAVTTKLREADDVASGILEEAGEEAVDLVAMSTHGRSGMARLVLGSVADKVVRGAHRPVLVVRMEDEEG